MACATPVFIAVAMLLTTGCVRGTPGPAPVDTRNDACQSCRMTVSDVRFAAQVAAPGEEPKFFDDIGCLARFLAEHPAQPEDAVAYVADHRTKAWIPAGRAVYLRVTGLETPMNSHLVAHADAASQQADAEAAGGTPLPVAEVFRGHRPPG
jgi:copper chaperone NosL